MQFIYEQYNANGLWGFSEWSYVGTYNVGTGISGGTSYFVNPNTGEVGTSGNETYTTSGTVYNAAGNTVNRRTIIGGGQYEQYSATAVLSSYTRGAYIGQVTAEDGTYPNDGVSNGYWYVKKYIADGPLFITPNGGEVITGNYNVQWSIGEGGLTYEMDYSAGQTWSNIMSTSAVNAQSRTVNFANLTPSNIAALRIRGKAVVGGVTYYTEWKQTTGVFTVRNNVAPLIPTLKTPLGIRVNFDTFNRFAWVHNDTGAQSKADVRYRAVGNTVWNTETVNGSAQETFIYYDPGVSYGSTVPVEWQVRTYDGDGLVSPWSDLGVYEVAQATYKPVIVSPTTTVTGSRPIIEWTSDDQIAYQLRIEDLDGVALLDTGEVNSTVKAVTSPFTFINGATYVIKVRVKNSTGVFSEYETRTVVTAYTPPALPLLAAYKADGAIQLVVTNPTPTGSQPIVTGNDIYKIIDGEWVRIASNVNATYTDYAVANGVDYSYFAVAIGETGTYSYSTESVQSVTFKGAYIHDPLDAEFTVYRFAYNGTGVDTEYTPESALMKFAGRKRPVVQFGVYEDYAINVTLQASRDMTPMLKLREFVANRTPVCYRDDNGQFLYGVIQALPTRKEYSVATADIMIIEIDYNVEV